VERVGGRRGREGVYHWKVEGVDAGGAVGVTGGRMEWGRDKRVEEGGGLGVCKTYEG